MNSPQKLGIKVFYYYLSKKILGGIILLVVSIIISSFKLEMISGIDSFMSLTTATIVVIYFINGLYVLSSLLIILGILISWINYISCEFSLNENALTIIHGILNKREVSIPYSQIENISINQSLNHKMMGICELKIETAGNNTNNNGKPEGYFPVIDYKVAQVIKDFILQKK